ncbi:MAG TPA: hypothetical protein PK530_15330, partial [Anaerolineales bacterium]|nr:hypothetical protein [Anaerolineales bacterium]
QLLEDVIEDEKLFEMTDWEQSTEFRNARVELQGLYDWWQIRKVRTSRDDFDVLDRSNYQEDTQQLIKLVELRHILWT